MTILFGRVTVVQFADPYRSPMPTRRRAGYTLLEVMIVLVVMSIVGAMAFPRVGIGRYQADAGMRTVQGVLQQGARMAVMRQSDVMVSVDTVGQRLRVVLDANDNHQVDPGESVRWHPLEEGARFATPPAGVACAAAAPVCGSNLLQRDGMPTIVFRRDGAVSTDVELYLRARSANPDDFRALAVAEATGRVVLYRYGEGSWHRAGL